MDTCMLALMEGAQEQLQHQQQQRNGADTVCGCAVSVEIQEDGHKEACH